MCVKASYEFVSAPRIISGAGCLQDVGSLLGEMGKEKVFCLTDKGIASTGLLDRLTGILSEAGLSCKVYDSVAREPGVGDVDEVMAAAKAYGPDCVIAIGGGSVLDIGKLCAVLVPVDATVLDLLDGAPVPDHSMTTVLIPTTSGTGSEATKNAIIAIPERGTKAAVVNHKLLPDIVLLDPVLTVSMPKGITATTGMDALCHAMECYLSKKANILSDMYAVASMKLIADSLYTSYVDPKNIEARWNMLLAANYAGSCITLSGTNAVHAMSYPLGTMFHIPHGQSNAMLLPAVMEYNLAAFPEKTRKVAIIFGYDERQTELSCKDYVAQQLHELLGQLEITSSLASFGVHPEDASRLAENAYANRRLMDNNPVDLSEEVIQSIYEGLLEEQDG